MLLDADLAGEFTHDFSFICSVPGGRRLTVLPSTGSRLCSQNQQDENNAKLIFHGLPFKSG